MKKLFIALLALGTMAAVSAKTADELRVYINPGHGSWTANDRPNPLVDHGAYSRTNTDTLGFFESNTNLRKGFGVLEKLIEYGLKFDRTLNQTGERWQIGAARDMSNNIVMSHVKCGPYHEDNGAKSQLGDAAPEDIEYYNRSLSEICAEVDANNFDMFISIHSNAATEGTTTNYPLFLYRGYDSPTDDTGCSLDQQTTSRAMADACWSYAIGNEHMQWTNYLTSKNLRGDINFYGSSSTSDLGYKGYLGVLKHGAPGFLVEGYFHTYQPARHRAMNWDVDYLEGYEYARGIADWFGLTKEATGDIYGIVRDQHEKFSHDYYKPNPTTDDAYLPLNGVKVILSKDGQQVAEYVTDNYYNGAFVFKDIEVGTYTLTFENDQYKPLTEPLEVVVTAAATVYPTVQLENVAYVPPAVVYETYPDDFTSPAFGPRDEYAFEQEYVDEAVEALAGKTVRRAVAFGDLLYVLAIDEAKTPTIIVYDALTKEVKATVATEGMACSVTSGDAARTMNCSDIQVTADGYLLATNCTENVYNGSPVATIYKWAKDDNGLPTGNPEAWITTNSSGNWYNAYVGETFAYKGTSEEGAAYLTAETIGSSRNVRVVDIAVIGGVSAAVNFSKPSYDGTKDTPTSVADFGDDYRLYVSPNDLSKVIIAGSGTKGNMREYPLTAGAYTISTAEVNADLYTHVAALQFFKYHGQSYAALPAVTEGQNVGVLLVDITGGLDKAAVVATVNTSLEGVASVGAVTGRTIVSYDDYGEITGGFIDISVVRDGKTSLLSTRNATQIKRRAEYAYNLNVIDNGANSYTFTFDVTGDVVDANIVLTSLEEQESVVIPVGAVAKADGASYTYDASELVGTFTWSVQVQSRPIAESSAILTPSRSYTKTPRGGVVVFTDPEYPEYFGYTIVAHGRANGFDFYDRDDQLVGHYHDGAPFQSGNGSSCFRGDQLRGKAVFADWSDENAGYWVLDPANIETAPHNMCVGEKDSTGAYTYNGVKVSGGSSCVAFQGTGADTKMYTFEEDLCYVAANGDNVLVRYDLGEDDYLHNAPAFNFDMSFTGLTYFANTNVDVVPTDEGMFVTQVRSQGNNATGCPGFLYIDNDGNILLNSADVEGLNSCNSAVALNADRSIAAVGTYDNIFIYDVTWNGKTPTLTYNHQIPLSETEWANLKFDPAGNLHGFLINRGYRVYSLVNPEPKATTPAKVESIVKGGQTEIISIESENTLDAAPVYYNLQGVMIPADNLTPGVYVKVIGNKAEKVIVK